MVTLAYLPLNFHMFYTTTSYRHFQYRIITSPVAYRLSCPVVVLQPTNQQPIDMRAGTATTLSDESQIKN